MEVVPFASPLHDPARVGELLSRVREALKGCPGGVELGPLRTAPLGGGWEYTVPFIVTGGTEHLVVETYRSTAPPLILYHNGMNSLPAAVEAASYYRLHGWRVKLVHVDDFTGDCGSYARLAGVAWRHRLGGVKLGLIGGVSSWLVYSNPPPGALERLGYKLVEVPLERLVGEYEAELKAGGAGGDLDRALAAYRALRRILGEHGLTVFTANCFDFLQRTGMTLCYPYSLLNSEGVVAGCEGDIPSTVAMHLGYSILDTPGFMGNVNMVNTSRGEIVLSHCTAPLRILGEYTLTTHYETGKGVAVMGVLPEGSQCILLRLSRSLDRARVMECVTAGRPVEPEMCRTRVRVRVSREAAEAVVREPLGNHHILFPASHSKTGLLRELLEVLGLEVEMYRFR